MTEFCVNSHQDGAVLNLVNSEETYQIGPGHPLVVLRIPNISPFRVRFSRVDEGLDVWIDQRLHHHVYFGLTAWRLSGSSKRRSRTLQPTNAILTEVTFDSQRAGNWTFEWEPYGHDWTFDPTVRVDLHARLWPGLGLRYELVVEVDGIALWDIAEGDSLLNDANGTVLWDFLLEEDDYR